MPLFACGINHKTAPLAIREKVVFYSEKMPGSLVDLMSHTKSSEAAILSTCNRTEIYCSHEKIDSVIDWLHHHHRLPANSLNPCLYIHQDKNAVQHLLRVASGLDSMVLGEPQIFGQLKTAYEHAKSAGTLGNCLQRLFQYVFLTTKKIRTETAIGEHPVSIASALIEQAKHIFADISQRSALLLGVGDTMQFVANYLKSNGMNDFWVASRNLQNANNFAERINARAIALEEMAEALVQVDMVIAATTSPVPIIGKGLIERVLKKRKRRLIFIADLAVPRNVEPEIAHLSEIYLYCLDDLQKIIEQNLQHRQVAVTQAEEIIHTHTSHYMQSLGVVEIVPLIRTYREKAEKIRDDELDNALQMLNSGTFEPRQVLEQLAYRLTNKIIHGPTHQLRKAAYQNEKELLEMAEKLLELN